MSFRSLYLIVLLLLSFSLLAEEVKISGGAAPMNNVFKKIKDGYEASSGNKLILSENGPDLAFIELEKGTIDGASGGVGFDDWMKMMEEKKHPVTNQADYKYRVIGKDLITVVTNKGVTKNKLSKDELKKIFTGEVKNWKEVGGPDLAIKLVLGTKIPGTLKVFKKQAMADAEYATGASVINVETAVDVVAAVAKNVGSIGVAAKGLDFSSITTPETDVFGRPITFITKGAPSEKVQKMLDFIAKEGKKLGVE